MSFHRSSLSFLNSSLKIGGSHAYKICLALFPFSISITRFPLFWELSYLVQKPKKKKKKKKKTCFQVTRIELGWQYCNISHIMGTWLVTSLITTLPLLPSTVIFISHPNQLFSTYLRRHFPLFSSPKPTTTTPSHSRLAHPSAMDKPKLCQSTWLM